MATTSNTKYINLFSPINLSYVADHLYVWGKNKAGKIAGKDVPANVPTIIRAFDGKKISSMSAGYSHAIVATGNYKNKIIPSRDLI